MASSLHLWIGLTADFSFFRHCLYAGNSSMLIWSPSPKAGWGRDLKLYLSVE